MSEHGFGNPEIVEEEVDILIIGGGMAACGCAFEMMRWAAMLPPSSDSRVRCLGMVARVTE